MSKYKKTYDKKIINILNNKNQNNVSDLKIIKGKELPLSSIKKLKIAIIKAEFNKNITYKLLDGAFNYLISQGLKEKQILIYSVPGAFEIPAIAALLARKKNVHGIITLGAVIRGDTDHYNYVCQESARGIMEVSLNHSIPITYGILTCDNEKQAYARAGGKVGNKGVDVADALLELIKLNKVIK